MKKALLPMAVAAFLAFGFAPAHAGTCYKITGEPYDCQDSSASGFGAYGSDVGSGSGFGGYGYGESSTEGTDIYQGSRENSGYVDKSPSYGPGGAAQSYEDRYATCGQYGGHCPGDK